MIYSLLFYAALLSSTLCFSQKQLTVGQRVSGDFNGDGKVDTAILNGKVSSRTKQKTWTLSFSDKAIPSMQLGCCDPILVNEEDLNGDKTTELSIFQAPENGCLYMWTTYGLKNKRWTTLFEPFLIATDCENFKPAYLQSRVFKENGKVYHWDVDPNDEQSKPIKKQVTLR